jgi:hypothetical protein
MNYLEASDIKHDNLPDTKGLLKYKEFIDSQLDLVETEQDVATLKEWDLEKICT